MLKELLLFVLR